MQEKAESVDLAVGDNLGDIIKMEQKVATLLEEVQAKTSVLQRLEQTVQQLEATI